MCELFGMSSNRPTDLTASLGLFASRGGENADNPDGWGLAYLETGAFRLEKEPIAAAQSKRLAGLYGKLHSELVLAHVRKAKHPAVNSLANTHPFRCSCCGRLWVFAHNGLVPDIMSAGATRLEGRCRPGGDTDSEYACHFLLEKITPHFQVSVKPGSENWLQELAAVSETVAAYGQFNFLMSNGSYLIAYGHDRLHSLERHCGDLRVSLIATEPLTKNEAWRAFEPGELQVYLRGERIAQLRTQPKPPVRKSEESASYA